MEVRSFDVGDDALLRRYQQLVAAADSFERPWAPTWAFEELAVELRSPDPGEPWEAFAAFDDSSMVGAGLVLLPQLDNIDKVYAGVYVDPGRRRRGIGTALVQHLVDRARAEGRRSILVESGIPLEERGTHAHRRFADAVGLHMASVEVHRVLDLPLTATALDALEAECAPHHSAYELRTFHDTLPDELVASYCYLENQIGVDAPTGEIEFEVGGLTPELFRERTERMLLQGRHRVTTLAIAPTGEGVAMTDLLVPREDLPKVQQWSTIVRRDHRGHRLGMGVKVANLRALQQRYPERTRISTWNEEANDPMVAINERLGFRPVELVPEFQLTLD